MNEINEKLEQCEYQHEQLKKQLNNLVNLFEAFKKAYYFNEEQIKELKYLIKNY